ncbi:MAG: SDR family NAD(P)-dependent oxidoreductase [Solirubrobacterales bacterium]
MQVAGSTVLLTGATGGLGRAIAAALAQRGAGLVLSSRSPEALEQLASELPGSGHISVPADLAQAGAATKLIADAGEIDILIANAGLRGAGRLTDYSHDDIERAIRVNLEAPMLMARSVMEQMAERGSGHMVFIASLAGKAASPRSSLYNATKFGLRGFALGLRCDLAPAGVGVSLVSPGFVRDAGMFAESGSKPPPGLGTTTPDRVSAAVVRAIEANKMEIAVAPIQQRVASHLTLAAPGIGLRIQSGGYARRAAEDATSGEPKQ